MKEGQRETPVGPWTSHHRQYLSTKEAALHLGLSHRSLERWRIQNRGPRCRLHGGRWAYLIQDLDDWSTARMRGGTW